MEWTYALYIRSCFRGEPLQSTENAWVVAPLNLMTFDAVASLLSIPGFVPAAVSIVTMRLLPSRLKRSHITIIRRLRDGWGRVRQCPAGYGKSQWTKVVENYCTSLETFGPVENSSRKISFPG